MPKDMPPVPKDVPPVPQHREDELPAELKPRNLDEVYPSTNASPNATPNPNTRDGEKEAENKDKARLKEDDAMSTHSSMTGMAL